MSKVTKISNTELIKVLVKALEDIASPPKYHNHDCRSLLNPHLRTPGPCNCDAGLAREALATYRKFRL